jgi:triosephosphate isomerase
MNPARRDALALATGVRDGWTGSDACEVVVCPAFPVLAEIAEILDGSAVALGAQNAHHEREGAFTGEVSAPMLAEIGCRWVIVGHSERRIHAGESSELVARKARSVLDAGLTPIVCVGESLDERERGATRDVVRRQVVESLAGLARRLADVVIAYEPVWAIGTGRTATAEQAQEVHAFVRSLVREIGGDVAARVRIQYGGSVKPENAGDLFAQPDVDGGLVGGASLRADSFLAIARAAVVGE